MRIRKLSLGLQGLSGEVVEGEGEESEHDDADQVVVQRVVVAEAGDGAIGGGFVKFDADAEEADDASGGDPTRGVEAAGRDSGFACGDASGNGVDDSPAAGRLVG